MIGGEAGIGKSRLVTEFSRRAESEVLMLRGACAPFGSSPPPFTPVVEALRVFVHSADEDRRGRLRAKAPALSRLLPELDPEGSAARRRESSEGGQSLIFGQLLGVLEDVATDGPLVLVLEDLHWADRSTLDLLALRSQTGRADRCLVVATYRSDELDPGHQLRLTLAELQRSGRTDRLELTRFGRDELDAQLTGILGHPPEYVVVDKILQQSDGNPFLAEELLAGASEAPGRTPTNVRDIVMSRVETLTEPTRRMLGVLSAAPRSMTHDDLAAVADMTELDLERLCARRCKNTCSYKPTKPAMAFAMRSCARRPMTRCLWASAGACTSGSRARSRRHGPPSAIRRPNCSPIARTTGTTPVTSAVRCRRQSRQV